MTKTEKLDRKTHTYKKSTIINKNSDKPKADKSRHYVDGKAFYEAMVRRRKDVDEAKAAGKPKPQISDEIGQYIMAIANNLSRKYQFANYSYKDEMIAEAIVHCIRYIDSFDVTKTSNPFSYYTQAVYFQFINRITEENKQLYIRCKATLDAVSSASLSDIDETSSDESKMIHDNMDIDLEFAENFVANYERAQKEKKKKQKAKKQGLDVLMEDPKEGKE